MPPILANILAKTNLCALGMVALIAWNASLAAADSGRAKATNAELAGHPVPEELSPGLSKVDLLRLSEADLVAIAKQSTNGLARAQALEALIQKPYLVENTIQALNDFLKDEKENMILRIEALRFVANRAKNDSESYNLIAKFCSVPMTNLLSQYACLNVALLGEQNSAIEMAVIDSAKATTNKVILSHGSLTRSYDFLVDAVSAFSSSARKNAVFRLVQYAFESDFPIDRKAMLGGATLSAKFSDARLVRLFEKEFWKEQESTIQGAGYYRLMLVKGIITFAENENTMNAFMADVRSREKDETVAREAQELLNRR